MDSPSSADVLAVAVEVPAQLFEFLTLLDSRKTFPLERSTSVDMMEDPPKPTAGAEEENTIPLALCFHCLSQDAHHGNASWAGAHAPTFSDCDFSPFGPFLVASEPVDYLVRLVGHAYTAKGFLDTFLSQHACLPISSANIQTCLHQCDLQALTEREAP